MILKSARLTCFRSIEDSGEFSIDPVTCLVGHNGAGKSAILEALYKLNPATPRDADYDLLDYPRNRYSDYRSQHASRPATVVTTTWQLDSDDKDLLRPLIGSPAVECLTIRVSKGYDNQQRWVVDVDEAALVQHLVGAASLEDEERRLLASATTLTDLASLLQPLDSASGRHEALLNNVLAQVPSGDLQLTVADLLKDRLPTFAYVTEYPTVPGEISLSDLNSRRASGRLTSADEMFLALLNLAGTSADEIQRIDRSEEMIAELESASDRISRDVLSSWSQDPHLRVEFRCDGPRAGGPTLVDSGQIFRTRIRDARHGITLGLEQQGSGFVSFVSFLVWLTHLKRTGGDRLVILLDQPGSTLEAGAQRDLVRYIDESRRAADTILYTTHSAFMIGDDNLASVRMVEKTRAGETDEGTRVRGTIRSDQLKSPAARLPVPEAETPATVVPAFRPALSAPPHTPLHLMPVEMRAASAASDTPKPTALTWDSIRPDDREADADARASQGAWSSELAFLRRRDH